MSEKNETFPTIPPEVLEQAGRAILRKRADNAFSNLRSACSNASAEIDRYYGLSEPETVKRAERAIVLLRAALDDLTEARKLSPLVEAVAVDP